MWHSMFNLDPTVVEKVLRSILIYLFLALALRFFGKRELGQSNTLDLVVLLLVANAVQNGIIGADNSVTGALIGASVLFGLNKLLAYGTFRYGWLDRFFEGTPTDLIRHGKPIPAHLHREQISLPELRAIARRQGFDDLGEVHKAILETNGVVSMFRKDEPGYYHPALPHGLRAGKRRRAPETT